VIAATLAIASVAALWRAYFDVVAIAAERRLSEAPCGKQAPLGRDSHSCPHFPLIAGVVLLAVGLKKTELAVDEPLKTIPAVSPRCGGGPRLRSEFFVPGGEDAGAVGGDGDGELEVGGHRVVL
jgi:Bacterial low temperature requirement A protein (LtrA)